MEIIYKEVICMPGHDQTGPQGYGSKTGWGAGFCAGDPPLDDGRARPAPGQGPGFNCSPGFGGGTGRRHRAGRRGFFTPMNPQDERCWLDKQKEALKNQLDSINQRLEALTALESQGS